ncbi:MAG: AAA family ATPase [Nitrososphaerota archaeon]|nr:AAA family ATPase [Nitrososphaerota archaeon]MDG7024735.1 AAA family ATPase [Nitrososphaerota archaeon]
MWSEKYRPDDLEEMVGNGEARAKLLLWLKRWKPGTRALLLVGPPGTGKTTTVHLTARELGLSLVELNASDSRTKERLSKKLGEAISSVSLFGGSTLIFLDEVDGLAGRSDYGAIDFVKDAVKKSQSPVVMAANDPDSDEVRKLGSATTRVEFRRPGVDEVSERLQTIARTEKLAISGEEIAKVAEAAHGDLRAAVNFLQSGVVAQKDEEMTAAESVNTFFGAVDERSALRALRAYPGQPREKVRDIFTAVSRSRVHEERKAAALDVLSRADVMLGRMLRGKDWRLLRYLDPMLASELWKALGDGGPRYTLDGVPWPLQLRIWNDSRKLKDIAALAGKRVWISQRGFLVEDMPYLLCLVAGKRFREEFVKSLGLEENYETFLAKESGRGAGR